MAMYPQNFKGKETLQPGARGEIFNANLPGYRDGADRINRTNNKLSTGSHDVLNIQYELDRRLPVLFKYGFAVGYNQIVMPKGRIVALDPYMNQLDYDTHKKRNVVTLANGGKNVKLGDDRKTWVALEEAEGADLKPDDQTGLFKLANGASVRPANVPIGMIARNEYTRDFDAFNGMQPGAILTDCIVELPLFLTKEKAEQNPWGSVYGSQLCPGDLVKSDENGRFVKSPLSDKAWLTNASTTAGMIELERQQVVGQVYEINRDLLPAGAAKYAQWALEDRMNFDMYNPEIWRQNNRRGEDTNERSPFNLTGEDFTNNNKPANYNTDPVKGWPYDNNLTDHDLHMLASTARKADSRMPLKYQLDNGIPGLTDGYNAVVRDFGPEYALTLHAASSEKAYVDQFLKTANVGILEKSMQIAITDKTVQELTEADFTAVTTEGQGLKISVAGTPSAKEIVKVKYLNELQGMVAFTFPEETIADLHKTLKESKMQVNVYVKYQKRGLAGVPTFLDWDGCQGTAAILLQK